MRRTDEYPMDPEVAAALDAIDATLAGEPVDPEHAEVAELALLLAAGRQQIEPEFARSLDQRVVRRFAPEPAGQGSKRGWRWAWGSAGGLAAGLAAVVAVVVVTSGGGGGGPSGFSASTASSATVTAASSSSAAAVAPKAAGAGPSAAAPLSQRAPQSSRASGSATAGGAAASAAQGNPSSSAAIPQAAAGSATAGLRPPANGRKIVQSAQLALTAAPSRIDDVAQQVFDVVGLENGIVSRSTVTATGGPDGYAEFQLSVPSANLPDAMTRLSRLRGAHVASRTDTTQDVNNQYVDANRRLADDRALRTALLKQLANAVTQAQIDSLNAQIHDAEAAIASDQAALGGLNHQINFSQISLTIGAAAVPVTHGGGSTGFTLGRAAHDAGRVLTVAAGVALIALAVLVPVGLLAGLALWIGTTLRRRRREQALDLA